MKKKTKNHEPTWKNFSSEWNKREPIPVEVFGVKYDSLTSASEATGKSVAWIKKNGKLL